MDEFDFDLPDLPEGEINDEAEDENWLFESSRDYLEQLEEYHSRD